MRILFAGATGAIGRSLIRCLKEHSQTVFGWLIWEWLSGRASCTAQSRQTLMPSRCAYA